MSVCLSLCLSAAELFSEPTAAVRGGPERRWGRMAMEFDVSGLAAGPASPQSLAVSSGGEGPGRAVEKTLGWGPRTAHRSPCHPSAQALLQGWWGSGPVTFSLPPPTPRVNPPARL